MQGRQMSEAVEFEWGEPVQVCLKYADGKRIQTTGGRTRFLFTLTDGRVMFHDEPEAEKIRQQFGAGVPFWIRRNRGRGKGAPATWEMWQGQPAAPQMESQLGPDDSQLTRDLARSIDHLNNGKRYGYGSVHGQLSVPKSSDTSPQAPPPSMNGIWGPRECANCGKPATTTKPGTGSPICTACARLLEGGTIERKPAQVASAPAPASSTGLRPETQLEDALFTTIRSCHRSHEYARQLGYASMPQFTGEDIRAMAITILIGKQDRERRGAA